jgi:hypothetical protein
MRLHHKPGFQFQEPAAAVTPSCFYEIQRPVILGVPFLFFNLSHRSVNYHQASGTQDGRHSPVRETDVSVAKADGWLLLHSWKIADVIWLFIEQPGAVGAKPQTGLRTQGKSDRKLV